VKKKAVVLLSGGMDSATALGIAVESHGAEEVVALHVLYKKVSEEDSAAILVAEYFDVEYLTGVITMPSQWNEASSVASASNANLIQGRSYEEIMADKEIPSSYVPARNSILTSMAAGLAEAIGARFVYTGMNALDYSGYPDCRPEFVKAMNNSLQEGQVKAPTIVAPLMKLNKAEIIRMGASFKKPVPFELTHSCYVNEGHPCGICDSCVLRAKGFAEAHMTDPAVRR
jgi:7-cyano-7-deazaguanine synthase